MTTQRDRQRLASAVARFARDQERWDVARERYAQELARANDRGLSIRELEAETGLTFGRVAQIIRGARGTGPGR